MGTLFHIAIGIVIGAFMPSVGRAIKAFWVKETGELKDKFGK